MNASLTILDAARGYTAAGLSTIPIAVGTKEPARSLLPQVHDASAGTSRPSWRMFQERLPTIDELQRWFDRTDVGIAIICGAVSGGLVVLDLESVTLYDRWRANVLAQLDAELIERLPVVATGKGRHVYFRMSALIGNRKLAMDGRIVLAETRGQGGYVLAPPSLHPSGAHYSLLSGDLRAIPTLDEGQVQAVLDAARALAPVVEHPASVGTSSVIGERSDDVIGTFNRTYTITAILEAHGYQSDGRGRYIRPNGQRGSVAIVDNRSVHYNTADPLYSEAPGGGNHSHTPFSAWCILKHHGDVKAAVREAARQLSLSHQPTSATTLSEAGRVLGLGDEADDTYPYFLSEGSIWMHQTDKDGTPKAPMPLCNFVARIATETQVDDGEHQDEWYTLDVRCQHRARSIEIKRTDFEGEGALGRIVAALGAQARVNPRTQPRFVLDAIKAFSRDVTERIIHTHTGWVGNRYLFANGAVDADGWHPAQGCQIRDRLQLYSMMPDTGNLADALAVFNDLLELAPPRVIAPLVGAVLLAPVARTIGTSMPAVHLHGLTGSHKTSVACAAMALMGDFAPMQPTDTWTSTCNSIQRLGWYLKDAPMLIDDFKAAHVKPQQVTFLLQNYGDNTARGRLDASSELRATFPMRCVLISSGEDQPEGEASTLARILSVPLERRSVNRQRLSAVQQHASCLHALTIDYLMWLAAGGDTSGNTAHYQRHRATLLAQLEGALDQAVNPGRIASNIAVLLVAWETFGRFLTERGHWPTARVDDWLHICRHELLALARTQLDLTTAERYSQIFLETVRTLVSSGKAVLLNLDDKGQEMHTSQVLIGAYDQAGLYLMAQTAFDEVSKHLRAAGRQVGFTSKALSQLFKHEGLLLSMEQPALLVKKRINGARPWCWHLPKDVLDS